MPISRQETGLSLSRATQLGNKDTDTDTHTHTHTAAGQLVSYKGTCHCGRNRFEADLPEIKVAIACNCSLCHKSGYLWAFPEAGRIEYTRGTAETLGTFDTESLSHEFCTFCGTGLYGTHKAGPLQGQPGLNVRCILGVNPFKIDSRTEDTLSSLTERPTDLSEDLHREAQQTLKLEGNEKLYTGSCQCGAVAFAVKTAPINEIEVKEDNCSICVRRAAVSIYPDKDQVLIFGKDNTTTYDFGRKFNQTPFCKTCGVASYAVTVGPPQSVVDKLPEEKQKVVEQQRRIQPVYVRAINGVDWRILKIHRSDEGTEGYRVSDE